MNNYYNIIDLLTASHLNQIYGCYFMFCSLVLLQNKYPAPAPFLCGYIKICLFGASTPWFEENLLFSCEKFNIWSINRDHVKIWGYRQIKFVCARNAVTPNLTRNFSRQVFVSLWVQVVYFYKADYSWNNVLYLKNVILFS